MPTVVPSLIDALVISARNALPDAVLVMDGDTALNTPDDFVIIGTGDVDSEGRANAATSRQEWANANYTAKDETGSILCAASSYNGDGSIPDARASTFALMFGIEDMLRANPSLGLDRLLWAHLGDFDYDQWQSDSGAAGLLLFRIDYRARI